MVVGTNGYKRGTNVWYNFRKEMFRLGGAWRNARGQTRSELLPLREMNLDQIKGENELLFISPSSEVVISVTNKNYPDA